MKSAKLLCVVVTALFAVLMLPVQLAAQQTTSGTNGQIVFNRQTTPEGLGEILISNPDGSGEHQLSLGDPVEVFSGAVWSSDGRKLLITHTLRFDSGGQCCLPFRPAIVNADGSNYTLLTISYGPFDMDCGVWSLDQTRLLCGFGGDQPGVFSIQASDGGDPVRLTTNPYGNGDNPTDISPDGKRFVFIRFKPGASPGPQPFATEQVALFVENIDGTGLRQLTPFGLAQPHEEASASWSPDGQEIISSDKKGHLFVIRPDGTGLTPIKLKTPTSRYFAFEPHWSPDGTRIVFCLCSSAGGIYTANRDGSDLVQVTNSGFASCPSGVGFENGPNWGTHPVTP